MKFETLLKRYINVGYVPLTTDNHTQQQECDNIVRWLWSTYKCHVSTSYCDMKFPVKPAPYMKFRAQFRINCQTENHHVFYADKNVWDTPDEAIFDGLRMSLGYANNQFLRKKYATDKT